MQAGARASAQEEAASCWCVHKVALLLSKCFRRKGVVPSTGVHFQLKWNVTITHLIRFALM